MRLSSYAQYWIRAYIIYFLLSNFRLVKVGTTQAQRKLFFRLRRERERMLAQGVQLDGTKMLAERLNVKESDINEMSVRMESPELSLDYVPTGSDQRPLRDALVAPGESPEAAIADAEVRQRLNKTLAAFGASLKDTREQALWNERLMAEEPLTLQELGERFGISRERARQLEERLKRRCREYLRNEFGPDADLRVAFPD